MKEKLLCLTLLAAGLLGMPDAIAVEIDEHFGPFASASPQVKMAACNLSIGWARINLWTSTTMNGGLSESQAESTWAKLAQAEERIFLFRNLAQGLGPDTYVQALRQVEKYFERGKAWIDEETTEEYTWIAEYCTHQVYDRLAATNPDAMAAVEAEFRERVAHEQAQNKIRFFDQATKPYRDY